jgi:hypothetical protein
METADQGNCGRRGRLHATPWAQQAADAKKRLGGRSRSPRISLLAAQARDRDRLLALVPSAGKDGDGGRDGDGDSGGMMVRTRHPTRQIRRLAFWRRTDEPLALDLKWPKALRNVYPATALFVFLTWLELGYGVTMSPRATATLGLLMIILAVVPALLFERRAFCRYGCLIGRVVGLYSTISPIEVRSRDKDVCRSCKSKSCLVGNFAGYPCPTGQCLGTMNTNSYCTVCTECFKTCPHDNVALNARPFCADLHVDRKPRRDEAVLALVLVALTSFHGLTMTPTWNTMLGETMAQTGLGRLAAFTLIMAAVLAAPFVLYYLVARLATGLGAWTKKNLIGPRGTWRVAITYAYPLIAVALMYHLAHNAGHLLMEGSVIIPVMSDPLGTGADFLGTATFEPRMLTSMTTVWALMIAFVLIGHFWAIRALERGHRRLARDQ